MLRPVLENEVKMKTSGLSSAACWAIAVACGFLNFLTLVPAKLPGLLFVHILQRYQTTRELATYPIFISVFIRCSGGPITGYFGQRFGVNAVIITGCALSSLGVGACFFANDIAAVTVLLGLVYGIGIAFSNTLIPQVLKRYFKKNFATANGISLAGICFGTFIAPPVIEWLFELYGVSGTFLVMGAIMLNSLPVALLFKLMTPKQGHDFPHYAVQLPKSVDEIKATNVLDDKNGILGHKQPNVVNKEENSTTESEERKFEVRKKPDTEKESANVSAENIPANRERLLHKMKGIQDSMEYTDIAKQCNTHGRLSMKDLEACVDNASHSAVKYSEHKNQFVETLTINHEVEISISGKNLKVVPKRKTAFRSLSVFVDPTFLSIMFTQSSEVFVLYMVLTTIVDYSREKGIDRSKEVYFLMIFPIAELFGRLGLSWIVDRHYLSEIMFSLIAFALLGVTCMLLSCVRDFFALMVGVVMFGIITSALSVVFPSIVYEFTDPENQIMALASRLIIFGPMCFAFASFIEYCKGSLGSYDWLYYILTMVSVLSGISTVLIPVLARRRERQKIQKRKIKELTPFLK